MNNPTKWAVGIIIAVAVIAVGYTLYKNPSSTSSKEPIKIGFIGALTGDGASFGETEKMLFLWPLTILINRAELMVNQ